MRVPGIRGSDPAAAPLQAPMFEIVDRFEQANGRQGLDEINAEGDGAEGVEHREREPPAEEETVETDAVEPTEVAEVTTDEVTGGGVAVEATDGEADDVDEGPNADDPTSSDDEDVQG